MAGFGTGMQVVMLHGGTSALKERRV
jgi:hypothetical protein